MRRSRTSFLGRLTIVALFLIGFMPGQLAVAAQDAENSHTNEIHNITITWTDAWEATIPADTNGTLVSLDQANSIFVVIAMIDSATMPPEEGVWLLYQDNDEIVEDNSTADPPSISWMVEGTGILQYAEAYTTEDGSATIIVSLYTVPIMQRTGIDVAQSEVTINGNPPLTGSILGDSDEPEDLTGQATAVSETRSTRSTRGSTETPEATEASTEEASRTTRSTRGSTETPDATSEATEETTRSTRTTRGSSDTPEATEEATRSTRTTRGTDETPEATEEGGNIITRTPRTGGGGAETPEPTEDVGAEPTEESTLSQQMDTFTGPVYGYTVSFDPNIWLVEDEIDAPPVDGVRLDGDTSTVFLIGTNEYGADPVGCLNAENDRYSAGSERISNWETAIGGDGEPLWFESDTLAWGVFIYTFTSSSGEEVEFVDYISCETIPDQDAVLIVQLTSLPDDYNDNLDAVLDILDTLEFQP